MAQLLPLNIEKKTPPPQLLLHLLPPSCPCVGSMLWLDGFPLAVPETPVSQIPIINPCLADWAVWEGHLDPWQMCTSGNESVSLDALRSVWVMWTRIERIHFLRSWIAMLTFFVRFTFASEWMKQVSTGTICKARTQSRYTHMKKMGRMRCLAPQYTYQVVRRRRCLHRQCWPRK